jgi:rhamnosyltransferase subunit B
MVNWFRISMKVLLTPIGSHGDVHPFVALGVSMLQRGHDVIVLANPHFQAMIEKNGLTFVPLGTLDEFHEIAANPLLWHPTKGLQFLLTLTATKLMRQQYSLITQHYEPGRTVVVHSPLGFGARIAQEKLGFRLATIHLAPSGLRSIVDPMVMPHVRMPGWTPSWVYRLLFWIADTLLVRPALNGPLNEFRAELGLKSVSRPLAGWWNSTERILGLFPDWFAQLAPDWPAQTRLCGFPLFDESGQVELPSDLREFLAAGPAPIVFTPGSAMQHGQSFFQAALDACQSMNCRAVFLTMYPQQLPASLPATIRHFRYVPFSRILPEAAAIVHHGGIGTSAQALAAGVPQLIMPMGYDQPDNAYRLEKLGVGVSLSVSRFTGPNVAARLRELLRPEVRTRCQELAKNLAGERSMEKACAAIEDLLSP